MEYLIGAGVILGDSSRSLNSFAMLAYPLLACEMYKTIPAQNMPQLFRLLCCVCDIGFHEVPLMEKALAPNSFFDEFWWVVMG